LNVLAELRERGPALPIVALLPVVDAQAFAAVLQRGASGVATWETDPDVFLAIIDAALHGRALLPSDIVQRLAAGPLRHAGQPTATEVAWLHGLAAGGTITDLAAAAGYSERSMYRLLGSLYRQLGATNRAGAVREAYRRGLL